MKINEMLTESQLDELKCWTGYKRVPGVPEGAPGSCRKATSEDTEHLDELSPQTLARYKKAAGASAREADKAGDFAKGNKRFSGIVRATKKEFDQATKKKPEQGVAEGFSGLDPKVKGKIQNIVSSLSDEYGMWDHKKQTFTPQGLEHLKSILKFNIKYIKYALSLTSKDFEAEGVAEGLGDTKTEVLGKYKGWRFARETQAEDDRNVTYYGAVSPDGKWHSLPKRATAEQFKQFVDGQGVTEAGVPAKYLSGKEKVSNISPVLTKPYGSAKQTKLMKNFFGSS
jgi:hypothetical protein